VALVYLCGLVYSISLAIHGKLSLKGAVSFFLSILGVGLFSYYQGRSASTNLAFVAYPAIILLVMYADFLITRITPKGGLSAKFSFSIIITFFLYSSVLLAADLPVFYREIKSQLMPDDIKKNNLHTRTERFVMENAPRNGRTLLISGYSGYYQLVSQSYPPVVFPSPIEFITVDDYLNIFNFLVSNRDVPVMIDSDFMSDNDVANYGIIEVLKRSYQLKAMSPDKNMLLFTR
jgi:hypothetical protein